MSESSTDSNNGSNSDPSEQAPSEKPVLPGESVLLGESALPEKSVLVVVTSAGQINDNYTTGIWFDEFADPFIYFRVQNFLVVVASPEGGQAPIDPRSLEDLDPSEGYGDAEVELANTLKLNDNIKADMFDALFFPGGHGTMFDLPDNPHVQRLVQEFAVAGKPIGAVCHGPAALVDVTIEDEAFVKGKKVTAFSNEEEAAVEMTKQMPFLLEDKLKQQGAEVVLAKPWEEHVVDDQGLITGQNPQSAAMVAIKLAQKLGGSVRNVLNPSTPSHVSKEEELPERIPKKV